MAPDKQEQIRQINLHAAPLLVDFEAAREAGADQHRMAQAIAALEVSVKLAKESIWGAPEMLTGQPVVHILRRGVALCGRMGPPSLWPAHHKWVGIEHAKQASCGDCRVRYREPG